MEQRNSKQMTKLICEALDSKKAEDIKIIDIQGISDIADYFVVANGNNQNQLLAMQDEIQRIMHENDIYPKQIEGNRSSTWILMDYEDVIVHLFSEEDRFFYNLERTWQDGTIIPFEEL